MDGIINVYKEVGYTSRDAVSRLMGILRQRKIGHTGTLDPLAEGVLPMCVGKATKVCELLMCDKKQYIATIKLGIETDTEDITGKVTNETDFDINWYKEALASENLLSVIKTFTGNILQTPPMYSAKKINGKRLYELARAGKTVGRKPASITIHNIEIKDINIALKEITILVDCSKGTYIRTLCRDIGEKLGCFATMKTLLRTKTGDFLLDDSYKLDEIEQIMKDGRIDDILIPVERIFKELPRVNVKGYEQKLLENGGILEPKFLNLKKPPENYNRVRMYNNDGTFKAIYKYDKDIEAFKVDKMF